MFPLDSSERLAERLAHVCRHWESQRAVPNFRGELVQRVPHAFSIALSRQPGTRGTLVGHEAGQRLGWPVYDHQLLERIAKDMGVRTKLLESVDEKRNSWLFESFQALFAVPVVSEPAYVHHLAKIVLALGVHGECVIVGRGASQILPAANTLRVRLVAPLQDRIAVISADRNMTQQQARHFVESTDREHNAFVRTYFQRDPTDSHNYDLTLNTSRFSALECAGLIIDALRQLQAREPEPSIRP